MEHDPASAEILKASAFLYPDDIPLGLLAAGGCELGDNVRAVLGDGVADALAVADVLQPLTRFSLIRKHIDAGSYSIHRLVQAVIRDSIPAEERPLWGERAVRAINRAAGRPEFYASDAFDRQVDAGAEVIEQLNLRTAESAELLFGFAARRRPYYVPHDEPMATDDADRADIAERLTTNAVAERHLYAALQSLEVEPDANRALRCAVMNHLGEVYLAQGRLDEAEMMLVASADLVPSGGSCERLQPGTSLHNLGRLCIVRRRYPEARKHFEAARELRERLLGPDHPATARTLYRLGEVALSLGMDSYAEQLAIRSLNVLERHQQSEGEDKAPPEEYAFTGEVLGLVVRIRRARGDLEGAARAEAREMADSLRALGFSDWDAVSFLCQAAHRSLDEGQPERSRVLFDEAVALFEQTERNSDRDAPDQLPAVNAIAALYAVNRDPAGVDRVFPRMRRLTEAEHGPDHPEVARCLRAWGIALLWQERDGEAEPLFVQALEIYGHHPVEDRELVGGLYAHYAMLLHRTGRPEEGRAMRAKARALGYTANPRAAWWMLHAVHITKAVVSILVGLFILYVIFG